MIQPIEDLFAFDVISEADRTLVVRQSETRFRPAHQRVVGWERLLE